MTDEAALSYLRARRVFLGESARAARVLGMDSAHLSTEAEALSWAITTIKAAAAEVAAMLALVQSP